MSGNCDASLTLNLPEPLLQALAERAAAIVLDHLQAAPAGSPYLTIKEAAEYARCKRQRIDDLLSARRLTRYKDGRRTLILRAELDAHLAPTTGPKAARRTDSMFAPARATVGHPDNRGDQ